MTRAVVHDADRHRYEIHVDGEPAGFTAYEPHGNTLAFVHTEIDERFEGRGLGSQFIAAALDDVRRQQLGVLAVLPLRALLHRLAPRTTSTSCRRVDAASSRSSTRAERGRNLGADR